MVRSAFCPRPTYYVRLAPCPVSEVRSPSEHGPICILSVSVAARLLYTVTQILRMSLYNRADFGKMTENNPEVKEIHEINVVGNYFTK